MPDNPAKTPQAFAEFDAALRLDPDELADAQSTHNLVTEHLVKEGVITGGFPQGSLARATMLHPLRDIDKVLILPASRFELLNRPGGADRAMDEIKVAVERHPDYRTVVFDRSRHALKMDLGPTTFSFDMVPAFEADDGLVLIADRTPVPSNYWPSSNTRELIKTIQRRNGECDGRFVHQVRYMKHLVRERIDGRLPGLHVETIAYHAIKDRVPDDEACARILRRGVQLLRDGYHDPTGCERISDRLPPLDREAAIALFANSAQQAEEAVALAVSGDDRSAIAIWNRMFGEMFPAPAPRSEREAARAAAVASGISSAGTPTRRVTTRQPIVATRSWSRGDQPS